MSEQSRRRCIGLDVHREFAQVAVWEGGVVTQAGRFATAPDEIRGFAADLGPADEVALEATGNTWAIAGMAAEQASILAETTKRAGGRGRQQWDATLKPVGAMQRGSTPSPCSALRSAVDHAHHHQTLPRSSPRSRSFVQPGAPP
ncbi:MAG TPA: hypothetical protein VHJ79_08880 [Mycobacterium sp.]|nr:hypothetical protein [Mycobacterium sp.]